MTDPFDIARQTGELYLPGVTTVTKELRKEIKKLDLTVLYMPDLTVINFTIPKKTYSNKSNRLYQKVKHIRQFNKNPFDLSS